MNYSVANVTTISSHTCSIANISPQARYVVKLLTSQREKLKAYFSQPAPALESAGRLTVQEFEVLSLIPSVLNPVELDSAESSFIAASASNLGISWWGLGG